MNSFGTLATASGLFAGTNIDDIIVLAVLSASSRASGEPKAWQIWMGQYIGVGVLVAISLLAALGLAVLLPERFTWLLGLVPLGLGVYKLFGAARAAKAREKPSPAIAKGLLGVVAMTFANGGDNVAAYTPIFRAMSGAEIGLTLATFAIGIAVWCSIGAWLVSSRRVTTIIEQWGHWIVPVVFILIGAGIIYKAGG